MKKGLVKMARTKGSVNKVTQTKREIQNKMKNKPARKKRVSAPKTIIEINENYRIATDPMNYVLERKKQKDDVYEQEIVMEDDEEVEIESDEPDAEKWVKVGYHSLSYAGIAEALKDCCHDQMLRKYRGKKIELTSFITEIKELNRSLERAILKK
mgnify:CR=1 FL=1